MTRTVGDETVSRVPHQAIYRRWRAQTFAQIVGQEAVVETLRNAVRTGRVAHAILFVGPRGTGKTSLARILAKAINCTDLRDGDPCDACPSCVAIREGRAIDLIEIDAASNRGIDPVRELRERINYAPTDLKRKVYILDEAHQITKDAWNALLKSLEEPPDFVVFMFASTHPEDFPPAILSRLQRFDVRRLTTAQIEGKLRRILEADGRSAQPAAVSLIARLAAGGMRDAESILDQLLASSAEDLSEARVRDLLGLADAESISGFVDALVEGDVASGVRLLDDLEDRGRDLRSFLDQVIEVIRSAVVGAPSSADGLHHGQGELLAAARRIAGIDPNRAGVGGLRLQLELALFVVAAVPGVAIPGAAPEVPQTAAVARPRTVTPATPRRTEVAHPEAVPSDTPARPSTVRPRQAPVTAIEPVIAAASKAEVPPLERSAGARPREAGEVAAAGTGLPGGADLATLRARWPEVVALVSAHPPTKPLIAVCRPISVEDGIVTLGFPEDQGFLRDVAERRRSVLEAGIGEVLGRPVGVRCVATNLDLAPPAITDPEAAHLLAEAQRIFNDDTPDAATVD